MKQNVNDNINEKNDWRLQGQDKYLSNLPLTVCEVDSSVNEHEHCEFCGCKFGKNEEDLHEGYCTLDKYHWICKPCFNDFKEMFKWKLI